ncbi:MAG: ribosome small subunit-dependent GTPase A [Acidobacteria bacterium]|nr:ribosome small subunit-dependent GTPase A [Acidobacteriota bacterium]MCA1652207.1 ribosome small subunit-dependent GTPase A [Acidobacteriota bacterium]
MSEALAPLGWNDRLGDLFAPYAAEGFTPGRVSLEHTHIYRVLTADKETLARVAGRLRHEAAARADFPAVGDWVALETAARGGSRIRAVLPRSSRFSRRAAGTPTEEQIVAANIDTVFLVAGLDRDFNPRRIERYLVVAWESGAAPVIVLNKADLVDDPDQFVADVRSLAPQVPVVATSCRASGALDVLRQYIGFGRTAALLGSSGVGKSSIVNGLIGQDLLRTRDVRESDSRGRHTSSSRQLVLLPGEGILIDTPGMRELQLWETGEALGGSFEDIDSLAANCRFRDCRHRSEPGCAVRAAAASGSLDAARLASFSKLQDEQAFQARQQDERAQIEEKRRAKVGSKALARRLKEKGRD